MPACPDFFRPADPECLGVFQRQRWIERRWGRKMRMRIGEYERHHLSRRNREFADGLEILADERDGSAGQDHIRTGDCTKRAVIESRHPRHYRSIAKTQN